MKDAQSGGDHLEINLFWPDLGVIHIKLKSDGLINLLGTMGTVLMTTEAAKARVTYENILSDPFAGGGNDVVVVKDGPLRDDSEGSLELDADDYL